jgi:hypothetical protein
MLNKIIHRLAPAIFLPALLGGQSRAAMKAQFAKFQAEDTQRQKVMNQTMDEMSNSKLMADRSAANFDEIERGTRVVLDTQTGERSDVDLADVHKIVENLNEYDSGRYQKIPLRDESAPLPGQDPP